MELYRRICIFAFIFQAIRFRRCIVGVQGKTLGRCRPESMGFSHVHSVREHRIYMSICLPPLGLIRILVPCEIC